MVATIYRDSMFKASLERLVGGVVKITGPWSKHFALREGAESLLFIPYGIGISPMRSMIKYIHDKCLRIRARLIPLMTRASSYSEKRSRRYVEGKPMSRLHSQLGYQILGRSLRRSAALEAHSYMSQDPHRE
jgi:hypothetical protein